MNNWRLLLLALVAVFQPIASFTERNLVDGRQQCCDRHTDNLLRDSRSSVYGVHRITKAELRRVNDRDEIRHDGRYVLRQRDSEREDRSSVLVRGRDTRSFAISRTNRVLSRPERIFADENRERRYDVQRRESRAYTREVDPEEQTRRILYRATRDSVMHRDARSNDLSSRNTLSRDLIRTSEDRMARDFEPQRNRMESRSLDLRRSNKDARDNIRRIAVARDSRDNLHRIAPARESRDDLHRIAAARDSRDNLYRTAPARESRDLHRIAVTRDSRDNLYRTAPAQESRDDLHRIAVARDSRDNLHRIAPVREARDDLHRIAAARDSRDNLHRIAPARESRDNLRRITPERDSRDNLHRITPAREIRDSLRRSSRDERDSRRLIREDAIRMEIRKVNRRFFDRERINTLRRETSSRADVRRSLENIAENREQERHERRSLSENNRVAERVRDVRGRENPREERRENRDANRRLMFERSEVRQQQSRDLRESREQRESPDRSSYRIQMNRRDYNRESRLINDRDSRLLRAVESTRDIRYREKQSRESREQREHDEQRVSMRITSLERDNRISERRARSVDSNSRDIRTDFKINRDSEISRERDTPRRQNDYRNNKIETRDREILGTHFRRVVLARNRDAMVNKVENVTESTTNNWSYVFYTLQGAYLCGLLMQMLTVKRNEKTKALNLSWWPLSSQQLIKVD